MKHITNKAKVWVSILTAISVALLIGSFFVPPMGVIDGSVLAAVGEIFGFAALWVAFEAITKGGKAEVKHGNTTVTVHGDESANN